MDFPEVLKGFGADRERRVTGSAAPAGNAALSCFYWQIGKRS
jgi:hypothetical protein